MKKYIGTKQIEAEPMTLGDFVQKTGRNPYGKSIENHPYSLRVRNLMSLMVLRKVCSKFNVE